MRRYDNEELDRRIQELIGSDFPDRPTSDISIALRVADFMESRGYTFRMTDQCPKSLSDCLWRAVFIASDAEYVAEDSRPAVAVCAAAVAALEAAEA
ncbi:MAG: hypothetical protein V3571_15380 [Pseudodesulfovibrio sp.]